MFRKIIMTSVLLVMQIVAYPSFAEFQAPGRAILEPPAGQVIYGIGQDGIQLLNSTDETDGQLSQIHDGITMLQDATGASPMLRHFYIGEYNGNSFGWTFENRLGRLNDYNTAYNHDYIGMFSFRFGATSDLDSLFNGTYDAAIRAIGQQAAASNQAMFFRPFYEFNQYGDSSQLWIDYAALNPSKTKEEWFIAAWIKFRTLVLEGGNNGNVAFVWCLLAANTSDFISFYPGDDQVDWVGMDIFSPSHLTNAAGPIMTWVRNNTDKPVILPEIQPAFNGRKPFKGTQEKQKAIDVFFEPLFNFIESNTEVKGLVYMNFWFNKLYQDNPTAYQWVVDVGLDSWGDGRVQPVEETGFDSTVFDYFSSHIGNSVTYMYEGEYINLADEDTAPPPPPPPGETDILVQDISLRVQKNGRKSQGIATIYVVDVNGQPVANADVALVWSGGSNISASGSTGASGTIDLYSAKVSGSGTLTATVTSISHASLQYNASLNIETSDSIVF